MTIAKIALREPGKYMVFDSGATYQYQCGLAFLHNAEEVVRRFRREGLFAKIVKYQKRGHPPGRPKLTYRPSYYVYVRPKVTKKQPSWFKKT